MKCWKKACSLGKNSFSLTPSRKAKTPLKPTNEISCICCAVCFLANRNFTTKRNYVDPGVIGNVAVGLKAPFCLSAGHFRNLNGTRSEAEHAELLLADPVGRVDRLRLAEIGDRLGAAAQRFIGEGAVVVGLDIGRTELDRL